MSSVLRRATKKSKQQGTEKKGWLHSSDAIKDGCVIYSVKFLGVTEVAQAKGTDVIREAIKKVQFANHIKKSEAGTKASKLRKVDLKISIDNVKIEDTKTKEELYCYPLHHISYCADDKRDKKLFAFIAKDKANPEHNCYVFECEKLAEELTLTVGQAFDLAYRRFLERKGSQTATKQVSAMEEQIKAAEAEKEALKKKIEELERAKNGTATNGQAQNQNLFEEAPPQTSSAPGSQDVFNFLGDFESPSSTAQPTANQRLSWNSQNSQELDFDPFAGFGEPSVPPVMPPQTNDMSPLASLTQQVPQQQQPVYALPRPSAGRSTAMALPPPPTKESIRAANRNKMGSASTGVTSPVAPTPAPPASSAPTNTNCHINKVPRRRSAASREKKWENFQTTNNTDLLCMDTGSTAANPFSVDPFEANSFAPLAPNPSNDLDNNFGNMEREMFDLQQNFSRGLTIDHDVFGSNA